MANRFPDETCVLCPNPSDGVGEHTWPSWFIKEFHGGEPFDTTKGGVPYTKRDGSTPVTSGTLSSIHVPMCTPCNGRLGTNIEEPAKDIVRRLLAAANGEPWPDATSDEVLALARWLLKVGLLGGHPKGVHDNPHVQADSDFPRFEKVEPEWMEWMRTGDAPPEGFSVYVTRRSYLDEPPWEGETLRIALPKVRVDSKELGFVSRSFGFRGVGVTIVWHPGWPILHPLVQEGRAAILWPNPNAVDFASLPEVHSKEFGLYVSGGEMHLTADHFRRVAMTPLQVGVDEFSHIFEAHEET